MERNKITESIIVVFAVIVVVIMYIIGAYMFQFGVTKIVNLFGVSPQPELLLIAGFVLNAWLKPGKIISVVLFLVGSAIHFI